MTIEDYQKLYPYEKVWRAVKQHRDNTWLIREGMLKFDEDTACSLAGPFDGGFAYYSIIDDKIQYAKLYPTDDELPSKARLQQLQRYNAESFPDYLDYRQPCANEEHFLKRYGAMADREKKEFDLRLIDHAWEKSRPTIETPIEIYICGNDDFTTSKFLATKEEALEEIELLESAQPLNLFKDLTGYYAS